MWPGRGDRGDVFLAVPSARGPGLGGRLARTPGQQAKSRGAPGAAVEE